MRASSKKKKNISGKTLIPIIKKNPKALEILDRYGVHFCAGCYLTFSSPLKKVAAYHAVPNFQDFLKELKHALKS